MVDAGIAMLSSQQGRAVELAQSLQGEVNEHMGKIQGDPNSRSASHWAGEARAWLNRIENLTGRMRGNTQQQWRDFVKQSRDLLDELTGEP